MKRLWRDYEETMMILWSDYVETTKSLLRDYEIDTTIYTLSRLHIPSWSQSTRISFYLFQSFLLISPLSITLPSLYLGSLSLSLVLTLLSITLLETQTNIFFRTLYNYDINEHMIALFTIYWHRTLWDTSKRRQDTVNIASPSRLHTAYFLRAHNTHTSIFNEKMINCLNVKLIMQNGLHRDMHIPWNRRNGNIDTRLCLASSRFLAIA